MEPAELMDALLELARDVDLPVRLVAPLEGDTASGLCRVHGRTWVVLTRSDPVAVQIDVLARGLLASAGEQLEGRYLPPAVRERIERARSEDPEPQRAGKARGGPVPGRAGPTDGA